MASQNITSHGKIKKLSESIVSVDDGLEHESVCSVTLNFSNLERRDYLRLARACLGKEPVRVTVTLAQTELPFSADGQRVLTSPYQVQTTAVFPGVA